MNTQDKIKEYERKFKNFQETIRIYQNKEKERNKNLCLLDSSNKQAGGINIAY